jgi:hypothetical protein
MSKLIISITIHRFVFFTKYYSNDQRKKGKNAHKILAKKHRGPVSLRDTDTDRGIQMKEILC